MQRHHYHHHRQQHFRHKSSDEDDELEVICQLLQRNDEALTTLSLSSRQVANNAAATVFLGQCLVGNKSLKSFSLQIGVNMTVEDANALLAGLRQSQVTSVKLAGQSSTDSEVLRTMYMGIQSMSTLQQLTLMDFWVGLDQFGAILANGPAPGGSYVIPQRMTIMSRWARHLRPMCESVAMMTPSLTKLELTSLGLRDEDVEMFVTHWPSNASIQELSLERNFIASRGVQLIMEAISGTNHPALQSLDLSGNTCIQPSGLQVIGTWLPMIRLKRLNVSNCNKLGHSRYGGYFEYHGRELVEGIQGNLDLTELDVTVNGLPPLVEQEMEIYTRLNQRGPNLVSTIMRGDPPTLWCLYFAKIMNHHSRQQPHPKPGTVHCGGSISGYCCCSCITRIFYYLREHPDLVKPSCL